MLPRIGSLSVPNSISQPAGQRSAQHASKNERRKDYAYDLTRLQASRMQQAHAIRKSIGAIRFAFVQRGKPPAASSRSSDELQRPRRSGHKQLLLVAQDDAVRQQDAILHNHRPNRVHSARVNSVLDRPQGLRIAANAIRPRHLQLRRRVAAARAGCFNHISRWITSLIFWPLLLFSGLM